MVRKSSKRIENTRNSRNQINGEEIEPEDFSEKDYSENEIIEREIAKSMSKKCVCIVVLGDIGRSPRMGYHASSLLKSGYLVNFIGYSGSTIPEELIENPNIWFSYIREPPEIFQDLPKLLSYPLKALWQCFFLTWAFIWMALGRQLYPDFILVQNPPSIPTLPLCWIYSMILWSYLVIDWHNYGFSLMALTLKKKNHPILALSKWIENYFGAKGQFHLCVTKSMKEDLKKRLNINAVTLYDRPPDKFQPLPQSDQRDFLQKFSKFYPCVKERLENENSPGKPGIVISTTSWTEDEDFNILLFALQYYDKEKTENPEKYPKLIVFITGKGPLREYYLNKIAQLNLEHVEINLPWLEPEDYPKLIACADLGVSLHTSSSGLDLPMKIVDMFGCGTPVCALEFQSINELVKHNENGYIFQDEKELSEQLKDWFEVSENPNPSRKKFRDNLKHFQSLRWDRNWKNNALPIFK